VPPLSSSFHLDMYRSSMKSRALLSRIERAVRILFTGSDLYGLEWGDPDTVPPLTYIRDHFLRPYIFSDKTVVEIGPGGGRWTRYMLDAKQIYAVDVHEQLLNELRSRMTGKNLTYVKNSGSDFPGIPEESVDFLFSFGTFVHLDMEIIGQYLRNMKRHLKPGASVVIQYSDKTKPLARANPGFSDNDPETMRDLVSSHGFEIYEEDTKTLWHSSVVRFGVVHAVR
jgi:SAM-dependent methyltransferase